jgi:hypothetical protein
MTADNATIQKWFDSHIDENWGAEGVRISSDDDEILVVVEVTTSDDELPEEADDKEIAIKQIARRFRKATRGSRMSVADQAQDLFERKVSWGVQAGEDTYLFTSVTAPAMTRLRMSERRVLDTLVNSGVAASRSEALAWCVKFVRTNEAEWLENLRDAFKSVEKVRNEGPSGTKS